MRGQQFAATLSYMPDTQRSTTLPQRPRLVPGIEVFDRREDELQIGLDPQHAVVAPGLPPVLMDLLRGLDGSRSTSTLLTIARDEHAERLRAVLTGLASRGLIEDALPPGHGATRGEEPELWSLGIGRRPGDTVAQRAGCAVVVHGGGRIAAALVTLLATSGIGHIAVEARGQVTADDLGSGYLERDLGTPRRQALAEAARRANPAVNTGPIRSNRLPDLVVLADAIVPAPELVSRLMAERSAHLSVRVRDGLGIVGPMSVPGRSSCLRCADLFRTELDSCWPRIAGQLAGRYQRSELMAAQASASIAAAQVLRMLGFEDTPPPTWNATLEVDPFAGTVNPHPWPPHPRCGCGASKQLARFPSAGRCRHPRSPRSTERTGRAEAPQTAASALIGKAESKM